MNVLKSHRKVSDLVIYYFLKVYLARNNEKLGSNCFPAYFNKFWELMTHSLQKGFSKTASCMHSSDQVLQIFEIFKLWGCFLFESAHIICCKLEKCNERSAKKVLYLGLRFVLSFTFEVVAVNSPYQYENTRHPLWTC